MKRSVWVIWLVGLICLLPVGAIAGGKLPWETKLPFKNATIHYSVQGLEKGEEVVYIRNHGNEMATYRTTVSQMMGMTMDNSTVEIQTPDFIYSYDLQEKSGFKGVNPKKYIIEEYKKLSSADKKKVQNNGKKMGAGIIQGMGSDVQQDVTKLLGYSCDKVSIVNGATTYLIHGTGLPLKTEMNMMGMVMTMEATSISTDKVPGKFFKHPTGIVAEVDANADAMSRNMAQQTIAMLIDPESTPKVSPLQMTIPGQQEGMSEEDQQKMQQMMQQMKEMLKQ
jgi:hypothetical protein